MRGALARRPWRAAGFITPLRRRSGMGAAARRSKIALHMARCWTLALVVTEILLMALLLFAGGRLASHQASFSTPIVQRPRAGVIRAARQLLFHGDLRT